MEKFDKFKFLLKHWNFVGLRLNDSIVLNKFIIVEFENITLSKYLNSSEKNLDSGFQFKQL